MRKITFSAIFAIAALLLSILTTTKLSAQNRSCPQTRLSIGNLGVVEFISSAELRSEPEAGQLLTKLTNGTHYEVLEGPVCTPSGTLWWKVRPLGDAQLVGYVAEGKGTTYWSYPIPSKTAVSAVGAFQAFENGYMIWRYDSGGITVYFGKDGGMDWQTYKNGMYARMKNNPVRATPPTGLFKPINGFGKLWGNVPAIRQKLGWAVAPEQAYTMTIRRAQQFTGLHESTSIPDGRWIYIHAYLIRNWGFE
jgi:hypothetical protein